MTAPASPTVRRRRLAAELRGIREDKGKSGDTVAAALRCRPGFRYEVFCSLTVLPPPLAAGLTAITRP